MVYYWFKSLSHRLIASHIAILSQSCFILYTVVVSGNEMGVCPVGDVCETLTLFITFVEK